MSFIRFILYEDNEIIILNKPSGLLSIPDGFDRDTACLKDELNQAYGRIWTVHRLDKMTSGVILFAKNEDAHRSLNSQFFCHSIEKKYIAAVFGFPIWAQKSVDIPLKINGDRRHRTVYDPVHGKPARTRFVVVEKRDLYSFVDVFPQSGLTHQIRAHASIIGFPVLGDQLYWRLGLNGKKAGYQYPFSTQWMFLHACELTFSHPVDDRKITITAPLPDYFESLPHFFN